MPPAVQALACIQKLKFLAIPGLYKALRDWPVLIYELLLADWHTAPASSAGIPADVAPGSARLYKAEDIGYRAGGAAIQEPLGEAAGCGGEVGLCTCQMCLRLARDLVAPGRGFPFFSFRI